MLFVVMMLFKNVFFKLVFEDVFCIKFVMLVMFRNVGYLFVGFYMEIN